MRLIRTAVSAFYHDREFFPLRMAAFDALLVMAASFGMIQIYNNAVNFAGQRWPAGTWEVLGYTNHKTSVSALNFLMLIILALTTFLMSWGVGGLLELLFDHPDRRSALITTLVVVGAIVLMTTTFALLNVAAGSTLTWGSALPVLFTFGLTGVPAALALTSPAYPSWAIGGAILRGHEAMAKGLQAEKGQRVFPGDNAIA